MRLYPAGGTLLVVPWPRQKTMASSQPACGPSPWCGAPGSAAQGLPAQLGLAQVTTALAGLSQSLPLQVVASQGPPCQAATQAASPGTTQAVVGGVPVLPETAPPRKRQRLVHLSTEEKASRRKMKNRVAAQSARDRKRALMCDLEQKAEELRAKNRLLLEKNQALRAQSLNLAHQNLELRRRLSKDAFEEEAAQGKCLDDRSVVVAGSSESAVLRGAVPQQWVLTRPPSQLVVLTIAALLTALRTQSATICLVSWMSWTWLCSEMLIRLRANIPKITQEVHLVKQRKKVPYLSPHLKIWGAHQLSWTPIMI